MQQLLETEKFLKRAETVDKEQLHAVVRALVIGRLLLHQDQRRYSPGVPAELGVTPVYKTVDTCAAE